MNYYSEKTWFASNPLETKEDLAKFLKDLLDPLKIHTSPGGARIRLGYTGTHYDEAAAQLEGFSRPIWGLASLLAGGGEYEGTQRILGNMKDKDQRMVECSAIGFSIAVAKEKLWDPLSAEAKSHFEAWLGGMNDKEMPNTNWLWFRVFANLGLSKAGSHRFDAKRMKADLDHLDTFYIGDGWSRDGPEGVIQLDYYSSSFAIQFAQLAYSKIAQADDPERCEEYRSRARRFALDFVHYFDDEGRAIPFGRSMTYRFAMSSFWGALAFADVELPAPLTWGVIKGLQMRNIRYWAKQPGAYSSDGTLTIGFCYPNHNITENYNSPGSPYWCCKSFVTLALPETHPFWKAKEEPYPSVLRNTTNSEPAVHIITNVGGHTYLLSSGQQCSYPVKQSAAKYGKLAYSSAFGTEVGGDNTFALSDDNGETWKCRRVETWLVPPQKETPLWHMRIQRMKTGRFLSSAEGGFAIYGQDTDGRALQPSTEERFGTLENGARALRTDANTNLMVPRAVLPTLLGDHTESQSDIWFVTSVFALPSVGDEEGARQGWSSEWEKRPTVPREIAALINARGLYNKDTNNKDSDTQYDEAGRSVVLIMTHYISRAKGMGNLRLRPCDTAPCHHHKVYFLSSVRLTSKCRGWGWRK
ncbi:hypothetical protein BD779DRAFT_1694405 [Infundibulicybe gibba]|nr:hypothetical protein BD779DRAFT_1694405 [Infundibulicybe gibba]